MKTIGYPNFTRISLLGWCLFDFANSIAAIIGGIYFTKWFTEDVGAGSVGLNILFFASAIIIIFVGKTVGKRIDIKGYKIWIIYASVIAITANLCLFVTSQYVSVIYLLPLSFIIYLIYVLGFQIGRICHNVYLRKVIPEQLQSKMSGIGTAANWAGSVFGILITIPVISSHPNMHGRELTFLIAGISFGILTIVAILLMIKSKEIQKAETQEKTSNMSIYNLILSSGKSVIIYFILFDVMMTVERNLPTFLTEIHKMNDSKQAIFFLTTLLSAMVGGLIASRTVNFKTSKKWLAISSLSLALSILLTTFQSTITLRIAFIVAGLSYGIIESAMRVNFMRTLSIENAGQKFGLYAIIERTSGLIGPIIWTSIFMLFSQHKPYIASMYGMSVLAFVAFSMLIAKFQHTPNKD